MPHMNSDNAELNIQYVTYCKSKWREYTMHLFTIIYLLRCHVTDKGIFSDYVNQGIFVSFEVKFLSI